MQNIIIVIIIIYMLYLTSFRSATESYWFDERSG